MEKKIPLRPGERLFLFLALAFSIFAFISALMIPQRQNLSSPGVFPIFITCILMGSVITILLKNRVTYNSLTLREEIKLFIPSTLPSVLVVYIGILLIYILIAEPLHFLPSSYLFLVGSFAFLKAGTIKQALLIGAGLLAAIYFIFHTVFKVLLW